MTGRGRSRYTRGVISFALLLSVLLVTAAAGCGGSQNGGSDGGSGSTSTVELPDVAPGPLTGPAALQDQFPPPDVSELDPQATAAVRAGQQACLGKTPLEIRAEYLDDAVQNGLDLTSPRGTMFKQPQNFRQPFRPGSSFASGQLAAGVYEETLPESSASYGFQGCVYELAREQARRMKRAARN